MCTYSTRKHLTASISAFAHESFPAEPARFASTRSVLPLPAAVAAKRGKIVSCLSSRGTDEHRSDGKRQGVSINEGRQESAALRCQRYAPPHKYGRTRTTFIPFGGARRSTVSQAPGGRASYQNTFAPRLHFRIFSTPETEVMTDQPEQGYPEKPKRSFGGVLTCATASLGSVERPTKAGLSHKFR